MLTFIRQLLGSALKALFVLGLLLILFVGYRVFSADQEDDALRMASKQDYLDRLASKARPANTPNIVFFLYDDLGYGDIASMLGEPKDVPLRYRLAFANVGGTACEVEMYLGYGYLEPEYGPIVVWPRERQEQLCPR